MAEATSSPMSELTSPSAEIVRYSTEWVPSTHSTRRTAHTTSVPADTPIPIFMVHLPPRSHTNAAGEPGSPVPALSASHHVYSFTDITSRYLNVTEPKG